MSTAGKIKGPDGKWYITYIVKVKVVNASELKLLTDQAFPEDVGEILSEVTSLLYGSASDANGTEDDPILLFKVLNADDATIKLFLVDHIPMPGETDPKTGVTGNKGYADGEAKRGSTAKSGSAQIALTRTFDPASATRIKNKVMAHTVVHELFHILGLKHPFDKMNTATDVIQHPTSDDASKISPEMTTTIKENIMNSGGNPVPTLKLNTGKKTTKSQRKQIFKSVAKGNNGNAKPSNRGTMVY